MIQRRARDHLAFNALQLSLRCAHMVEARYDAFALPFNYIMFEQVRLATNSAILIFILSNKCDINMFKKIVIEKIVIHYE